MAKKVRRFTKKDKILIEDFIHSIDDTISIEISENKRFECDIPNKTIYLGIKNTTRDELKLFNKWFAQQPEYIKINKRIVSILHEVGHFKTFDKAEFEERNLKEELLTNMYENDLIDFEKLNFAYWNLPNERKATMWAIKYYIENKKYCDNLVKLLKIW